LAGEVGEESPCGNGGISEDQDVGLSSDPSWSKTSMGWPVVPWGCKKLLQWIDQRYGNPPVVITENGCAFDDESVGGKVHDAERVAFLRGYLLACHEAIESGVDLRGYFAWSLMDNFEWAHGFTQRFGMHYVDYETGERYPKDSAAAYAKIIADNGVE
jgi:beta-glucosidase